MLVVPALPMLTQFTTHARVPSGLTPEARPMGQGRKASNHNPRAPSAQLLGGPLNHPSGHFYPSSNGAPWPSIQQDNRSTSFHSYFQLRCCYLSRSFLGVLPDAYEQVHKPTSGSDAICFACVYMCSRFVYARFGVFSGF